MDLVPLDTHEYLRSIEIVPLYASFWFEKMRSLCQCNQIS